MNSNGIAAIRAESEIEYAPDICYDDWRQHVRALMDHIDSLDKQIATLKAALIRERERYLDDFIHQDEPCEDRTTGAVLQLARELPEIDWRDMQ